ncbi:hypothetical protein [Pedobacter sp.]
MKCKILKAFLAGWGVVFLTLLVGCKQKREVSTSFYFWKTVYQDNKTEQHYLQHFNSKELYVRIMDIDNDEMGVPTPIAPINFKNKLPGHINIIPVVFIVNDVLKNTDDTALKKMAANIIRFVNGKAAQAGKQNYTALQIDCDWTATTRQAYFSLLKEIKLLSKGKVLSATLRLHQLKNQEKSGVPPVDKVLLMCYNMGNLRKYGSQNSILDLAELKKYANKNLGLYTMPVDLGLPLFSWAVAFRNNAYAGISKKLNKANLADKNKFNFTSQGFYSAKTDLPQFGIYKNDEIRYEESKFEEIKESTAYLAKYIANKPLNLVFYHLDESILKNFSTHDLEEINHILR